MGVEYILKNALLRRSLDNVTVVVIAFESFQKKLQLGINYQPNSVCDKSDASMHNIVTDTTTKQNNSSTNLDTKTKKHQVLNQKHS